MTTAADKNTAVDQLAQAIRARMNLPLEVVDYAARKKNPDLMQPSLFDASPQRKLADLGAGHWITMHASEAGEGGHRVFVGDDGKMKTGKFAGKTFGEAFSKSRAEKSKRSTKRGEKHEQGQPGLFETETQPTLPGVGPGNAMEVDAIKTAEPEVEQPNGPTAKDRELAEFEQNRASQEVGKLTQLESDKQPTKDSTKPESDRWSQREGESRSDFVKRMDKETPRAKSARPMTADEQRHLKDVLNEVVPGVKVRRSTTRERGVSIMPPGMEPFTPEQNNHIREVLRKIGAV